MSDYIIKFKKPYKFEGKEYTELDLTKIEELTVENIRKIDKIYNSRGEMAAVNELSMGYACVLATEVTGQPLEFFQKLPAQEGVKLKLMVGKFFFAQD